MMEYGLFKRRAVEREDVGLQGVERARRRIGSQGGGFTGGAREAEREVQERAELREGDRPAREGAALRPAPAQGLVEARAEERAARRRERGGGARRVRLRGCRGAPSSSANRSIRSRRSRARRSPRLLFSW
jgi:hypothetical protein